MEGGRVGGRNRGRNRGRGGRENEGESQLTAPAMHLILSYVSALYVNNIII